MSHTLPQQRHNTQSHSPHEGVRLVVLHRLDEDHILGCFHLLTVKVYDGKTDKQEHLTSFSANIKIN